MSQVAAGAAPVAFAMMVEVDSEMDKQPNLADCTDIHQLIQYRDHIVHTVDSLAAELDEMGIGVSGPLVDSHGFPFAHVDLVAVRNKRATVQSTYIPSYLRRNIA